MRPALLTAGVVAYPLVVFRLRSDGYLLRRSILSAATVALAVVVLQLGGCGDWWMSGRCLGTAPGPGSPAEGLFWGVLVAGSVGALIAVGAGIQSVAARFRDQRYTRLSRREVWLVGALIVFGTALPEEVIFRGVLFTAWEEVTGPGVAVVVTSLAFGLWHIAPERERLRENRNAIGASTGVLGAVAFTAVAGAAFAALRIATGGIWAGVLVHAVVNVGGMLTARSAPPPPG